MKRNRNVSDAFLYLLGFPVSTYFRPRAGDLLIVKLNFSHPRVLVAAGAAFSVALGASGANAQGKAPTFDAGSILVSSSSTNSPAVTSRGLRVAKQYKNVGWSKLALAPGTDVAKTIASLRAQGIQAEPNYIRRLQKAPNDTLYSGQWAWNKIGAPAAWDITTGGTEVGNGKDVVVAILDSGITPSHPDLKANLYVNKGEIPGNGKDDDGNGFVDDVNGYDFAQDNGVPDDGNEHGTHVAGTIGAVGNNRTGVTGVNWRVKLLSCRIGSDEGAIYSSAEISALDYIVGLKKAGVNIRVANHSYGGYYFSQAEYAAFQRASAAGILNVCAAANDGYNNDYEPAFPASFRDIPGLISVAASDQNDMPATFSNTGYRSVDLAAPGVDILSTLPPGHTADGSLYGTLSGTSMASPHVAGALALLLSQNPGLSMQQAEARLYATVDKLPQWSKKVATGGRLNLAKLLAGSSYAVSGRILRANGTPVSGVTVAIRGTGTLTTTTDSTGFYRFTSLPLGRYSLTATLNGFTFAPATGSSASFSFTNAVYSLTENFVATPVSATYSVSGTTFNAFGRTQAGVEIYANNSAQPLAVSDARGKYIIDDLVAGTYALTARYQGVVVLSGGSTTKSVQLGTTVPSAVVDWQVPNLDRIAPTIRLTSPVDGQDYPQGQLKAITGNAYDNDQLASLEFTLYQYKLTSNGTTYIPYNWTTGTFDSSSFGLPKTIALKVASTPFNVALPELPIGEYYLYAVARDRSGYGSGQFSLFSITKSGQTTNPNPQQSPYPRFTFTNPTSGAVVRALVPFTATGTAHSDNGVQTLNFYLQQVDDRGANLGYYDWVNKRWVSSLDSSTTLTQNFNGGSDVKWSLPMPALSTNRYVLYAYGVALDGSQPPADGSLDDNVPFRASPNGAAPSSKSGS